LDGIATIPLFSWGDNVITTGHVVAAVVLLLAGALTSRVLQSVLGRGMRARNIDDEGLIGASQRLAHYAVLLIAAGYALKVLHVDLRALFAAGAVAALAVGFALQNVLQNFVAGVLILMERSITPADVLEVDGRIMRVERMKIRTTVARTWDDEEIIIPNSVLVQSSVKNLTLTDELYRLRAKVGVSYDADVDQVIAVLSAAAVALEGRSLRKDPVVLLLEFGDSAIVFDVSIWIEDPWAARTNRSLFNVAIWRALKEAEITIAYPQLDVHLRSQS